jgi:hypothetical protein
MENNMHKKSSIPIGLVIREELMLSPAEYVFKWLKNKYKKNLDDDSLKGSIELALLSRNEPLINLGVATYGELAGKTRQKNRI